jgi:hypothetical protein
MADNLLFTPLSPNLSPTPASALTPEKRLGESSGLHELDIAVAAVLVLGAWFLMSKLKEKGYG